MKETSFHGIGWGILSGNGKNISSQIGIKLINHVPQINGCYNNYSLYSQFTGIESKLERVFNPVTGACQAILSEYDYHIDLGYPVLKEEKVTLNNGDVRRTNYRYAFNTPGDFVFGLNSAEVTMKNTLNSKHYWQPLEVVVTETAAGSSTVITGGAKYSFGTFGGSKIHLANFRHYTSASDYRETVFSSYNSKGNLQEKYQVGAPREVYLWGYFDTYPVAKIIGSTYAIVSAWITPSILNNPSSDLALRNHLNSIRTNLSLSASTGLVSTYTYKPLIGVTSETDAKGLTRYFEYDHFHRLNTEKDSNENLTRSIVYKYKN